MQKLESRKYKKKELYPLFGYEKAPTGGSKKTFENKLTECCKWNTANCKTTEINVIEVYKQPLETEFKHGNTGNTHKLGKIHWQEKSNSQFNAAILLNKIEWLTNKKNDFVTIGVLAKKCGLVSDNVQAQNHINTEIIRNISKLEKLNLIKVQVKYNANSNGKLTEISEKQYNEFKKLSSNTWKKCGGKLAKSFNSFYQFYNVFSDNLYKNSIIKEYIDELKKETSYIYVFKTYKLEFNFNADEKTIELAVKLNELLLDDEFTVTDKIENYVIEIEEHYEAKEKEIKLKKKEERKEKLIKPTGFGTGFKYLIIDDFYGFKNEISKKAVVNNTTAFLM